MITFIEKQTKTGNRNTREKKMMEIQSNKKKRENTDSKSSYTHNNPEFK